jgi:hypothetical protein
LLIAKLLPLAARLYPVSELANAAGAIRAAAIHYKRMNTLSFLVKTEFDGHLVTME